MIIRYFTIIVGSFLHAHRRLASFLLLSALCWAVVGCIPTNQMLQPASSQDDGVSTWSTSDALFLQSDQEDTKVAASPQIAQNGYLTLFVTALNKSDDPVSLNPTDAHSKYVVDGEETVVAALDEREANRSISGEVGSLGAHLLNDASGQLYGDTTVRGLDQPSGVAGGYGAGERSPSPGELMIESSVLNPDMAVEGFLYVEYSGDADQLEVVIPVGTEDHSFLFDVVEVE